ncbi:MAG: choice-of-anchor B family protein [bacterium]|nr:choice-of-anchor B family protein [bacterium]
MWRYFVLLFPLCSFAQTNFNVQLLDQWTDDALVPGFNDLRYSDCWGYTANGEEYAMLGSTEGVHFFRISENDAFEPIDFVEGNYAHPSVVHRDIKTYQNYAFLVCDEGTSSLQIVDLQYLPDSVHVVYENDSTFTRVHNLFIDEPNELMYACSVQPSVNGTLQPLISMQVYSISDVLNPVLMYVGPNGIPEVHDAYVRDNIAYLNCGFDGVRVYDFSDPANPIFLQNFDFYQDQGYNHQGWLSPDGTKYVFADETNGSSVKSCSVNANHEIDVRGRVSSNAQDGNVPHNVMITNDFAFVAYYNEGLRVYDIRPQVPQEIAHFDTYPEDEELFMMNGAWGVYSELPSERILVSDRKNGLHLLEFDREVFQSSEPDKIICYPNPTLPSSTFTIRLEEDREPSFLVEIHDTRGREIYSTFVSNANYAVLPSPQSAGIYSVRVSYPNEDQKEVAATFRLAVF